MDSSPPAGPRDLARLRRYTWWFLIPYPLVAVGTAGLQVLRQDRPVAERVVILACFTVAAAVAVRWFDTATRDDTRAPLGALDWIALGVAVAGLVGSAAIAAPFAEVGLGWLLLPGGLAAALVLRLPPGTRPAAMLAMTAATAVAAGVLAWASLVTPVAVMTVTLFVPVIGMTLWIQWWTFDVARQLEQSRRVAGELAVAEERLRFAAELHDIQGHHLQVIALKSELSARLGRRRPNDAMALMREVQDLARDALSDTRAVVAGYRHVTPRTEITNATRVLTAAGFRATARLPEADSGWDGDGMRDLGLLIREATTNILRHTKPGRADFDLTVTADHVAVRIRNNGGDTAAPPGGTGLTDLRERFERAGGTLEWLTDGDHFTITAQLPRKDPSEEGQAT